MTIQRTAIMLFAALLLMSTCANLYAEGQQPSWSTQAEHGRALYYGTRSFKQAVTISGAPMPASTTACVQCHGPLGEGSREANIAAPDIRINALHARGSNGADAVMQAIQNARRTDGQPLGPSMPRYAPTLDEQAALQAFWPWLGDASQPQAGLSANELRIGVMLDGLKQVAAREQVMQGVQNILDQSNAMGGVHGRKLRMVASQGALPEDVFALVASALLPAQQTMLRERRLPSIATLDMQIRDVDATGWHLPLLPGLTQQARFATQQLQSAPADCEHLQIDPQQWAAKASTDARNDHFSNAHAKGARLCVAAFLPANEVDAMRTNWHRDGAQLVQLIELSGLRSRPIDEPGLDHRLVLAVPMAVAEEAEKQQKSLWYVLGQASARTAIEALSRSGRNLVPEMLIAQTRSLTGFEPVRGAPLAYSRNLAHGWLPTSYAPSLPSSIQAVRKDLP